MRALVLAAALVVLAAPARADGTSEMAAAVQGFYGAYSSFHPSDGIPDAKGRARYEPYISPALDKLLADGNRAEAAFAAANKGFPPLIEGDLFTSNFEGATSFEVGRCTGDARSGQCSVMLGYDDRQRNPKDKPVSWSDTVYLISTPAGWRVDDIGYGADWAFANRGRMSQTLKDTIENAGG